MRRETKLIEQKVTNEDADFWLLVAFIKALQHVVGKKLKYRIPRNIEEAFLSYYNL
jgi:hypothetical protein